MQVRMINTRALQMAIEATVGKQNAPVIDKVYLLLDKLERDVRAECAGKDEAEYKDGFEHGFKAGYEAAVSAQKLDSEQPALSEVMERIEDERAHQDEDLVSAVASLEAYQGDSGDEDRPAAE